MYRFPQEREFKVEGCAGADGALDMNLACVLLNNPVGNGKSKTCATPLAWSGRGFCSEERVIDALQMFRRNTGTGIGHNGLNVSIEQRGDAQPSTTGHGFFGVQKKIEEHLLQFAGVTVNRR